MSSCLRWVTAFTLVVLFAAKGEATPVTFNYAGTVASGTGIFSSVVGGVTGVTGTFTFDNQVVDSTAGAQADLFNASTVANQPFSSVWNMTLQVLAISLTSATNSNVVGANHHQLELLDTTPNDQFSFRVNKPAGTNADDTAILFLRDAVPATPDGVAVGSNNLTGTAAGAIAILSSLNPALFSVPGTSSWEVFNSSGVSEGLLTFRLTSISPVVPEPSSLLLLGTGLAFAARRLRKRR